MGRGGENKGEPTATLRRRANGATANGVKPQMVGKSKQALELVESNGKMSSKWEQRLLDVKDDLQVLRSIWFHPLKKSGTHAERLDAFYAPQATQCTKCQMFMSAHRSCGLFNGRDSEL